MMYISHIEKTQRKKMNYVDSSVKLIYDQMPRKFKTNSIFSEDHRRIPPDCITGLLQFHLYFLCYKLASHQVLIDRNYIMDKLIQGNSLNIHKFI